MFVDAVRREEPDAPPDWCVLEGGPEAAVAYGRLFDLVIIGANGSGRHTEPVPALLPEDMALGSGRPVLVMPRREVPEAAGRHVAVAWNGSREAARAVCDAIPFLAKAEQVTVLSVGEGEDMDGGDPLLAAHLARHGIATAFRWVPCRAHGEVDALLLDVDRHGVDLLVMGCYGRARGVELVLGGMSRDLLHRSPVPLLMSH
jgi:nucleotide-binding universal stress UspA family protein